MSTNAQIEANRRNALRSTGPKTAEGKARVSQNAVKHGVLSGVVPSDTPGFLDLLMGLYETIQPTDDLQRYFVDQIAVSMQRVGQLQRREAEFFSVPPDKHDEDRHFEVNEYLDSQATRLAHRYETAYGRQIERNLKLLQQLKANPISRSENYQVVSEEIAREEPDSIELPDMLKMPEGAAADEVISCDLMFPTIQEEPPGVVQMISTMERESTAPKINLKDVNVEGAITVLTALRDTVRAERKRRTLGIRRKRTMSMRKQKRP